MPGTAATTTRRQWLSVIAVTISAFAFVTSEFLPVGLLLQIARDLGVTPGIAGLMVTTPGVLAAISAPALTILAGRIDRRNVFLLLTAVLLASNLVCATSTHFVAMLLGRAMLGAALGGFWTLATAAAGRLVQPADAAKATATILTGVMLATVVGVPLGTFIASLESWRASFFSTGALAAVALALQAWLTPSLPSATALRFGELVEVLRRPFVSLSMLMIALVFGAHFSTYTYIAPWLQQDFFDPGDDDTASRVRRDRFPHEYTAVDGDRRAPEGVGHSHDALAAERDCINVAVRPFARRPGVCDARLGCCVRRVAPVLQCLDPARYRRCA